MTRLKVEIKNWVGQRLYGGYIKQEQVPAYIEALKPQETITIREATPEEYKRIYGGI